MASFVLASQLEAAPSPPTTGVPDDSSPRAKRMREAVVRQRSAASNSGAATAGASNSADLLITVKEEGSQAVSERPEVSQGRRSLLLPAASLALPVNSEFSTTPFGDFEMGNGQ